MATREHDEEFDDVTENNATKTAAGTDPDELRILEAVLYASDELMNAAHLKTILPSQPDARRIRSMVEKINMQLQKERHPFEIVEIGGGYQFRTITYYHPWVRQIFKEKAAKKLSIQALECLAIIAYKQPISKAEIEVIRGVVSDGAMKTLLEKRLITITGRSEKPGRPLLYGTTQTFLTYFGLNRKEDLPRIEEFEAMAREKMEDLTIDDLEQEEIDMKVDAVEEAGTERPVQPEEQSAGEESSLFEVSLTDEDTGDASAEAASDSETPPPAASSEPAVEESRDEPAAPQTVMEAQADAEETIEVKADGESGNAAAAAPVEAEVSEEAVTPEEGEEEVDLEVSLDKEAIDKESTDAASIPGKPDADDGQADEEAFDLEDVLVDEGTPTADADAAEPSVASAVQEKTRKKESKHLHDGNDPAHDPMFELETTVANLAEIEKEEAARSAAAQQRNEEEEVFEIGEVAADAPAPVAPEEKRPEETSSFEVHLPEPDQATADSADKQAVPPAVSGSDSAPKKTARTRSTGGKKTDTRSRKKTGTSGTSKKGTSSRKRKKPGDDASAPPSPTDG